MKSKIIFFFSILFIIFHIISCQQKQQSNISPELEKKLYKYLKQKGISCSQRKKFFKSIRNIKDNDLLNSNILNKKLQESKILKSKENNICLKIQKKGSKYIYDKIINKAKNNKLKQCENKNKECDYCKNNEENKLKKCSCKQKLYCSKNCQKRDWLTHRDNCSYIKFKDLNSVFDPTKFIYAFARNNKNTTNYNLLKEYYLELKILPYYIFTAKQFKNILKLNHIYLRDIWEKAENIYNKIINEFQKYEFNKNILSIQDIAFIILLSKNKFIYRKMTSCGDMPSLLLNKYFTLLCYKFNKFHERFTLNIIQKILKDENLCFPIIRHTIFGILECYDNLKNTDQNLINGSLPIISSNNYFKKDFKKNILINFTPNKPIIVFEINDKFIFLNNIPIKIKMDLDSSLKAVPISSTSPNALSIELPNSKQNYFKLTPDINDSCMQTEFSKLEFFKYCYKPLNFYPNTSGFWLELSNNSKNYSILLKIFILCSKEFNNNKIDTNSFRIDTEKEIFEISNIIFIQNFKNYPINNIKTCLIFKARNLKSINSDLYLITLPSYYNFFTNNYHTKLNFDIATKKEISISYNAALIYAFILKNYDSKVLRKDFTHLCHCQSTGLSLLTNKLTNIFKPFVFKVDFCNHMELVSLKLIEFGGGKEYRTYNVLLKK